MFMRRADGMPICTSSRMDEPTTKSEMTMMNLKKLTVLLLALAAPIAFAQQSGSATTGVQQARPVEQFKTPKLDRAQLDALLAQPGDVVFLDVRRPDELTRIGGFPVYLSIQTPDVEKYLAYIPKDRKIIPVSNHAVRAQRTGDLLTSKGFKVAGAAGVQDYEAEGGTLLKVEPRAPRVAGAPAAAPVAEKR